MQNPVTNAIDKVLGDTVLFESVAERASLKEYFEFLGGPAIFVFVALALWPSAWVAGLGCLSHILTKGLEGFDKKTTKCHDCESRNHVGFVAAVWKCRAVCRRILCDIYI
jgi:hypothetical protein